MGSRSRGRPYYHRSPFSRLANEKAYLLGLRWGDVSAVRDSPTTIRVRLSTTHPAMAELFREAFGKYGHCTESPDKAYLSGRYCWKLAANLDKTFGFLVPRFQRLPRTTIRFYNCLAGYSDAEACWCLYSNKGHPAVAFVIESKDKQILTGIHTALSRRGFHPLFYGAVERGKARLELRRKGEVIRLASSLISLSHHGEKIARMGLVMKTDRLPWRVLGPRVRRLKLATKRDVIEFVSKAERQYKKAKRRARFTGSSASLV